MSQPLRTNLPVVLPDREPLTEREAREVGDSCYRLAKLRLMLKCPGPFDLMATESGGGSRWGSSRTGYRLTKLEAEAIIALLIERETMFLASFNVAVQQ